MRVKNQKPSLLIFSLFVRFFFFDFFCRLSESWRLWSFIKGKQGRWKSTDMSVRAQAKRLSHISVILLLLWGSAVKRHFFCFINAQLILSRNHFSSSCKCSDVRKRSNTITLVFKFLPSRSSSCALLDHPEW